MTVFFSVNESDPNLYIFPKQCSYMNWAIGEHPELSKHFESGGPLCVSESLPPPYTHDMKQRIDMKPRGPCRCRG